MTLPKYHRNKRNQVRPCHATVQACTFDPVDMSDPMVLKEIAALTARSKAGGVNVTAFETAYVTEFKNFVDHNIADYSKLLSIPMGNRPILLRSAETRADIINSFQDLKQTLLADLNVDKLNLTISSNNRDGSDMEELNSGASIELKLGSATDANIGLTAMGKILRYNTMKTLPWQEDRDRWRDIYDGSETSMETIIQEHSVKLKNFANKINRLKDFPLDADAQKQLNAYYAGVTIQDEDKVSPARNVIRYSLKNPDGWVNSTRQSVDGVTDWVIEKAEFNKATGRVNTFFVSKTAGVRFRATYNYKNSHYMQTVDGKKIKAPAKLGLGSPSFNCWFIPLSSAS